MTKDSAKQSLQTGLYDYYQSQAAQKKYLDALITLTSPSPYEVVLDVGTGSGTVSFFLADRVKKVYGIDPNSKYIERNQVRGQELLEHGELLPHVRLEFIAIQAEELFKRAEDIETPFPPSYFDFVVCWASVHHFTDYKLALKGIYQVTKPGGKVIIFDAFFPEAVRDLWQLASTVHDPTTMEHHTYFEYMEMLREAGFTTKAILPFRHPNNLDKWLATIDRLLKRKSEEQVASEILELHRGKSYYANYQAWLEKARAKGIKATLREDILAMDDEKKTLMSLKCLNKDQYEFTYDTFVLSAVKEID